jgi:cation diffusion facilitator family transporter
VSLAGIAVSSLLAALNVVVGLLTHSTSVVATGVEFAGDVVASTVVFLGMLVATRPADANHPYGHGRVETIAAFVVGLILTAGGAGICWSSLQAVNAVHPPPSAGAIVVLVVAIAARSVMSVVKFRVGSRIQSASLVADAWNDTVDIVAAAVALIAVGLAMFDSARFLAADHYGGFTVGIIVVLTAIRVLRDSALELMDTMPDPGRIEQVRAAALEVPGVRAVEKCLARKTGFSHHVDLHVEVDPAATVATAHQIAGHVRSHLRATVPWVADVIVHVEPAGPTAAASS